MNTKVKQYYTYQDLGIRWGFPEETAAKRAAYRVKTYDIKTIKVGKNSVLIHINEIEKFEAGGMFASTEDSSDSDRV